MKKTLVMVLFALTVGLTACGGSDNAGAVSNTEVEGNVGTESTVADDAELEEIETEDNGMDLSIYPSSNIAEFEANGIVRETYDQLYAKIEPLIAETYQQDDGTTIYKDANGNDLLILYYEDGEADSAFFSEFYENGNEKSSIYVDGIGDSVSGQRSEKDVNGQYILQAWEASRGDKEFLQITVYDYHANGNLAVEKRYEDDVIDEIVTYNENGDELSLVAYSDGVESYRVDSTYDAEGKLIKEEDYYSGNLEGWTTYEYNSNGNLTRENRFSSNLGENAPYVYTLIETYDDGVVWKSIRYQLDEGKYFEGGEVATEEMYELMDECEYYESGNLKKEINYAHEYLESGTVAFKRIVEFDEDGYCTSDTYYDRDGNAISE